MSCSLFAPIDHASRRNLLTLGPNYHLVPKDLSERWHSCPTCGAELDRDENAALNILRRYELHGPIRERKKRKATRKVVGVGSAPQRSVPSKEGTDHCRSPRL
ncbi:zinc ribbon domain-containing protein [Ktedonobacter racemifer]|uniref:zinc ribbon domain-containing protein n=1 Tax=Ktedonobacter racemifer TaxID=363277 RepID=UPI00058F1827|nr:zinc ribbon domain-containing protein [Ktedonobacter racemifer]